MIHILNQMYEIILSKNNLYFVLSSFHLPLSERVFYCNEDLLLKLKRHNVYHNSLYKFTSNYDLYFITFSNEKQMIFTSNVKKRIWETQKWKEINTTQKCTQICKIKLFNKLSYVRLACYANHFHFKTEKLW